MTSLLFHSFPQQIDPAEDSSSAYMSSDDDVDVIRNKFRPLEISSYLKPGMNDE